MNVINVGIIGYGFRGAGVAKTFQDFSSMFRVGGACDLSPERQAAARAAGIDGVTSDYRALLDDKTIQAIYVGTPQATHCPIVLDALAAGKDVYCEKPMALSLADCDRMIAAAKASGRVLLVGLQMRYHAHLNRMAQLIQQGAIGSPAMVWLDEYRNPFPATMKWALDKSRSGGMLVEKSCHHFDVFNWFAGSRPTRVLASGGALVHKEIFGIKSSVADHAVVTVEYESGCKASYKLCMFAGAPHEHEYGLGYHFRDVGVMGTTGMLRAEGWDLGYNIEQRFAANQNTVIHKLSSGGQILTPYNQNGNAGIFYEFFECVTQRRHPFTSGEIGRMSLAVSLAAEQSLELDRWVEVAS